MLDAEITATLDLDFVTSIKAHPTTMSRGAREALNNILHEKQISPETPPTTIFGGSTPVPTRSGKGFSLPPLHAPSFGKDTESLLKEEWSIFLHVDAESTGVDPAHSKPSLSPVYLPLLSKRVADST